MGKKLFWFIQFFYYSLVCVVFAKLLDDNAVAVATHAKFFGNSQGKDNFLPERVDVENLLPKIVVEGELGMTCDGCEVYGSNESIKNVPISKGSVGVELEEGDRKFWKRIDESDFNTTEIDTVLLRVENERFVPLKLKNLEQVEFNTTSKGGGDMEKWAHRFTQISLFVAVVAQSVPCVDNALDVMGLVGVVGSWSLIIVALFGVFDVEGDEGSTKTVNWSPPEDILEFELNAFKKFFGLCGLACGAWGVLVLVPGFTRMMKKPKDWGKATLTGHFVCGLVYCLGIFIYIKKGDRVECMKMIPDDSDDFLPVAAFFLFRMFVICNMISSFALTCFSPASQIAPYLEKLVKKVAGGLQNPKVVSEMLAKILLTSVQLFLCFVVFQDGSFDLYLTLIASIAMPLAGIIFPVLTEWLFRRRLAAYGILKKEGNVLGRWITDVCLVVAFGLAIGTLVFGPWSAVTDILKVSKFEISEIKAGKSVAST